LPLVYILPHHCPEEMLCMLIAVLGFDVVTIEYCRASQGEIAFVLPFGIGNPMFATAICWP